MSSTELPGEIGPYRPRAVLGSGGMGVVYLAEHQVTGRQVALKTVRLSTADALAGIRLEIETLSRLRHPGIVEILDHGSYREGPWYAMQLLRGQTLADRNRAVWPRWSSESSTPGLPLTAPQTGGDPAATAGAVRPATGPARSTAAAGRLPETLAIFRRLCDPLSFLHVNGVIHRDLKPANVFLSTDDRPVLMDFGLMARAGGSIGREALERAGGIRGTLSYLAPEVIEGQIADSRADLYALGCMLWEALTGWPPFQAATGGELLTMHVRAAPGKLSDVVSGIPPALDELVSRLLAKRPVDRLGHADDVAEALSEIAGRTTRSSGTLTAVRAGQLFRPRLVGRSAALSELLDLTARLRGGTGGLALIAGESGIGKTFLASEVAQKASLDGIRIITGECAAVLAPDGAAPAERVGSPLHPLRQLLQALGDRRRQFDRQTDAPDRDNLFATLLPLLAPYESSLGELAAASRWPAPPPLPTEAARERLLGALKQALDVLIDDGPALLVLDDLQWADDLSLAFLSSLGEALFATRPFGVIGTFRTDEATDALRGLAGTPWIRSIQLDRLGAGDVEAIVAQMLAVSAAPGPLVNFVQKHAEGIPFFVAEYLRAATANGLLTRRKGQWHVEAKVDPDHDAFADVTIPRSLAGLVQLRLSRLSTAALATAQAGAVLGRDFEDWVLAATSGLDEPALAAVTRELIDRQVLEGAEPGHHRFLHDKIRETVYGGIDPDRRRALHLASAAALEARQNSQPQPQRNAELAHHLLAAGEPVRALEYLVSAGEHALRVSAHGDAQRHFREALALEQQLPERWPRLRRAQLERRLGEALQGLGKLSESAAPLSRAAAELGWPVPPTGARLAFRLLVQLVRQLFHRLFPGSFAGRLAQRSPLLLEAGRVFDRMQAAFYYTGRDFELLFANLTMLNLTEVAAPSSELALAYGGAAATCIMISARSLARTYFGLAFDALKKAPDPVVESQLEMLFGLYHNVAGEREPTMLHIGRAMELAEQTGFDRRRDEAASIRAGNDLVPGRHEAAAVTIAQMEASATRRGDTHMLSWARLQRAECEVLRGDFDAAHALLLQVQDWLPRLSRPEAIWTFGQLAYVLLCKGDLAQAGIFVEQASELALKGPPVHAACAVTYARIAEVRLELLRAATPAGRKQAARAAARACRFVAQSARPFPVMAPMAALHGGALAALNNRPREAQRLWRKGLDQARALNNEYAEARLLLALGRWLYADGVERTRLEATAQQRLAALGVRELSARESVLTGASPAPALPEVAVS